MISSTLFKKLDISLSVIGVVLGILISLLYLVSPTIQLFSIGIALTLSCSLYFIIVYSQLPTYPLLQHITKSGKKLLDITFLLLFSLSLITMHNSDYRPPIYFLLYSLCVGSIAESIYFSSTNIDYLIQYLKIILLSFNIRYSIFNLAGLFPGIDPFAHAKMNYLLSQTGNIEVLFIKEKYFPIMHIQTAILELLTNTSLKSASDFAIIVPFVFASIFIYLVSKDLFGHRVGLFALLLINISDYSIYWGSAPQTTTYGLILYYLLIYIFVKSYFLNPNLKFVSISIFLSFILIITHAVSSFIFLLTTVSLSLGISFYNFIYKERKNSPLKNISILIAITLIQQWFVATYYSDGRTFFDVLVSTLNLYTTTYAGFLNRPETISAVSTTMPPFLERFADTYGLFLLLFFGISGSLFCLSDKYRNYKFFSFIFALTVLFGITFSFPLFGIRNIMPSRWFVFEYFLLSIFASFSIFKLSTYVKSYKFRHLFIATVFISIAFFMSASTISNLDSPLWLKTKTVSTTYTLGETRGAETLSKFGDDFVCDYRFGVSVISLWYEQNSTVISSDENFGHEKIFIWRSYMEQRPIGHFASLKEYYKPAFVTNILGKDFRSKLEKYNKIYFNKDLSAYYVP